MRIDREKVQAIKRRGLALSEQLRVLTVERERLILAHQAFQKKSEQEQKASLERHTLTVLEPIATNNGALELLKLEQDSLELELHLLIQQAEMAKPKWWQFWKF